MNVIHNPSQNRFEVALAGGALAELSYVLKPSTLTIIHTYVPPAFAGQGVAGRLTQKALDYAVKEELEVIPLCSFAVKYIERRRRQRAQATRL